MASAFDASVRAFLNSVLFIFHRTYFQWAHDLNIELHFHSFLPPISVCDWSIFCCGILIFHIKKRNEIVKNKFHDKTQQKDAKKARVNIKLHF